MCAEHPRPTDRSTGRHEYNIFLGHPRDKERKVYSGRYYEEYDPQN